MTIILDCSILLTIVLLSYYKTHKMLGCPCYATARYSNMYYAASKICDYSSVTEILLYCIDDRGSQALDTHIYEAMSMILYDYSSLLTTVLL